MDAAWFLKDRTNFIRYYYDSCVKQFYETQQKIDKAAPPYDDPPFDDGGEPAFLEEWMDAQIGIDIVGVSCVSLLSDSLKLYFNALQTRVIGFEFENVQGLWKSGFLTVYKKALGEILKTDWSDSSINFDVIEQVVLARNRGQHGTDLTSLRIIHDTSTLKKYPKPFFANEDEISYWKNEGDEPNYFFSPSLEVNRANLFAAIGEIEKLVSWIAEREDKIWEWRRK